MSEETVSLEVVDFLLGRLMGEIQINRELNEKVGELKIAINDINKLSEERLRIVDKTWQRDYNLLIESHKQKLEELSKKHFRREKATQNKPKGEK